MKQPSINMKLLYKQRLRDVKKILLDIKYGLDDNMFPMSTIANINEAISSVNAAMSSVEVSIDKES